MAKRHDPTPVLEWIAAALGLLVALGLMVIIGRSAVSGSDGDVPLLDARVEEVVAMPNGHLVRIRITNRSGQTAAAVQVEGKMGAETSTATLDYVPGHSVARGGLLFSREAAGGAPTLRVMGYELP